MTPFALQLAACFEALGGHGHGGEFALFQESCGFAAFCLLSWADLDPSYLSAALETNLAGVGEPENTLVFKPSDSNEWWTKDTRFWMAKRGFVQADQTPEVTARDHLCQHLQAERVRLLQDLQLGEKIFVFRSLVRNLDAQELTRLHAAARRYGELTLLYVQASDAFHPPGSVENRRNGLMIGYMKRLIATSDGVFLGPGHED